LDLSGVIEVVRRDTGHERALRRFPLCRLSIEITRGEIGDCRSERAMRLFEERDVLTPSGGRYGLGTLEPV
jgi:hypothetical protein